jgi:uncharacterized protein YebE (UPF0316 family)
VKVINTIFKLNEISGNRGIAILLLGVDTTLFLLIFKNVISGDLTVPIVFTMAFGYMAGYTIGCFIEEKMALGKVNVVIKISKKNFKELSKVLTQNGFIFVRTKRVYSQNGKLKKLYQGIVFRKELPKLKKILKDFSFVAYLEPIKGTFGKKILTSKEYSKKIRSI